VDSGAVLARAACDAGASLITVLSAAGGKTIRDAVAIAHGYDAEVVVDHLSTRWDGEALAQYAELGVDRLGLHLPKDLQSGAAWQPDEVRSVVAALPMPVSLAGGLDADKIARLSNSGVDLFVVGGFLLNAADPENRASLLKTTLAGF
jgi:3-hexulose-6-phosphate synthase/6-phospho-3-hexuloisomerase